MPFFDQSWRLSFLLAESNLAMQLLYPTLWWASVMNHDIARIADGVKSQRTTGNRFSAISCAKCDFRLPISETQGNYSVSVFAWRNVYQEKFLFFAVMKCGSFQFCGANNRISSAKFIQWSFTPVKLHFLLVGHCRLDRSGNVIKVDSLSSHSSANLEFLIQGCIGSHASAARYITCFYDFRLICCSSPERNYLRPIKPRWIWGER